MIEGEGGRVTPTADASARHGDGPWWLLVFTKSNSEKKAERWLSSAGWTVYCPTYEEEKIGKQGVSHVERPLFPKYVFVLDAERDPVDVQYQPGVSHVVKRGDKRFARLHQDVIDALRSTEQKGIVQEQAPTPLEEGDPVGVDVTYGGIGYAIVGTFLRMEGEKKAIVLLSLFGEQREADVDLAKLKRSLDAGVLT